MKTQSKLKRHSRGVFGGLAKAVLTLALATLVYAQEEPKSVYATVDLRSNSEKTRSEGLLLEAPPTYIAFTGSDGLILDISLPRSTNFDYTIMFWFRSV